MGGRLDSTNVVTPLVSVITPIAMDHMAWLGDSIAKIAAEKAGIIKHNTPVVIGEFLQETKPVFDAKANEMSAPIFYASEIYETTQIENGNAFLKCAVSDKSNQHTEQFTLDLNGSYQLKNIKTVLAAEKILATLGFEIDEQNEKFALAHVKSITGVMGRWDVIAENPLIIYDVAHNKDGIAALLHQLNEHYSHANHHFVMGFVNDKDISAVLDLLPVDAQYYFTNAHIPRALPHAELRTLAKEKNLNGESFDDVNEAITAAKNRANKNDVIIVCGSFFILAEVKN
jgi:dihydrofolate synthase/folylpolyglutamate synthase